MLPANPGSTPQWTHVLQEITACILALAERSEMARVVCWRRVSTGFVDHGRRVFNCRYRTDRLGASHGGSYAVDEFVG
jgi:hypothetical protein